MVGPGPAAGEVAAVIDAVVLLAAVLLLAVLAWYLTWTAARLDRLHARVEGARFALDAQLQRRAAASQQLAISGLLDPASSLLLAQAAHDAREAGPEEHELRESDLSRALRATLEDPEVAAGLRADPVGAELLGELVSACQRVELARRFHNDAVRGARVVRGKRVVRYLRLAGRAPLPQTVEMDDTVDVLAP
jgi:hypothetical protein